jgi:hypothetical protein
VKIVIDDGLRPVVTEFIVEMLNDPHCESILLDVGEDARVGSDLPVLYLDIAGKHYDYILSIVGDEYSARIQYANTRYAMTEIEGERGAWGLRKLLGEIKTKLWEDK